MSNFNIEQININSKKDIDLVSEFLKKFDLEYDEVDYTIVIRDENKIIATCSKKNNLIKCIAVCTDYANQNFSNKLLTDVIKKINDEAYDEAFIITKFKNKNIFEDMGFTNIYQNEKITFLTNRYDKYQNYIEYIKSKNYTEVSIIVMNCNPFTLGHKYIIENASKNEKKVLIIPVKEEASFFTYDERYKMIVEGTKEYKNVEVLSGTQYIISNVIFPSYFIASKEEVIKEQTLLDANMFIKIFCENLNIKSRYVGEEPLSKTTNIYNETLKQVLTPKGIVLNIIPRITMNGDIISASLVRKLMFENKWEDIKILVPSYTFETLMSDEIKNRVKDKSDLLIKKH